MQSSAGGRYSAGIVGSRIPALQRDHYCGSHLGQIDHDLDHDLDHLAHRGTTTVVHSQLGQIDHDLDHLDHLAHRETTAVAHTSDR